MNTLVMTKRGAVTLPPALRKRLGIDKMDSPLLLVEERDGGVFLQPATALPVRAISRQTIDKWIADDEAEMADLNA
jgi:bifunctional DNA-binding transcriptional regulator/antitoxin component of YhaV-PrlF toxin-antitoxin module